jgi:hypothetical protein
LLSFLPPNDQETLIFRFGLELAGANAIGLVIAIVGLLLSARVGLGMPFIEGAVSEKPIWIRTKGVLGLCILLSIGSIILVLLIGIVFTALSMALQQDVLDAFANLDESTYPSIWKWFLVSFHAGISEEIFFRLGLMTIFVWIGNFVHREHVGRPGNLVMWVSVVAAGFSFGIAHLWGVLPVPDILILKSSVVVQNSMIGILFGWLYWKFGLESATLTHILVDIGFYVVFIPVTRSNSFVLIGLALVSLIFIVSWAWKAIESDRLVTDRLALRDENSVVEGS